MDIVYILKVAKYTILTVLGPICLGVFFSYLTFWILRRVGKQSVAGIGAIVAALAGGSVLSLFENLPQYHFWFYPIGLLIGAALYMYVAIRVGGADPGIIVYFKDKE